MKPSSSKQKQEGFWLDLKKLLASPIRQRILEVLSESKGEIRVMQLVRLVGSPYNDVNRNLGILETEGIITNVYSRPVKHGVIRTVKLNRENPKTAILLQALKLLANERSIKE
jgi:predicted transcriptional regulator